MAQRYYKGTISITSEVDHWNDSTEFKEYLLTLVPTWKSVEEPGDKRIVGVMLEEVVVRENGKETRMWPRGD